MWDRSQNGPADPATARPAAPPDHAVPDDATDHAVTPGRPAVRLRRQGLLDVVQTDAYDLLLSRPGFHTSPYAVLRDPAGRVWSSLNLLSSVHTLGVPDEVYEVQGYELLAEADRVTVLVRTRSTAWTAHELRLVCRPDALELTVRVRGEGRLTDVHLLGGAATLADGSAGSFVSSVEFASLLVPAPGEPVQLVRPSHSAGQLGVVGDADPGRLHAVFSPPPLALGFGRARPAGPTEVPQGDWLGVSLRAPVDALTFTSLTYAPLDGGFDLRLAYEGHTAVDGGWDSPVLVLRPAATGWAVLEDHRRDLLVHGCAPDTVPADVPWWREPLFCGWGAQCARVAVAAGSLGPPVGVLPAAAFDAAPEPEHFDPVAGSAAVSLTGSAAGLARQDVYEEFLTLLADHRLDPGTVVIDDRWQAAYGTAEPDPEHWPDLKGWIARQHAAGRRVLLWWKAWDATGLPAAECVRDAAGRPVAADPGNPAYRRRLAAVVAGLLGPDGADADGLKVDFSQRAPSGTSLSGEPGGVWGIAALHTLLATMSRAAKRAKPDALLVCHTVHPAFADVCDMVRLNDVSQHDVHGGAVPVDDQLRMRHAIATRMLPGHLVDTDQWPMPDRAEWRRYVEAQADLGVPALYYLEHIDRSGEALDQQDLAAVAASWRRYRRGWDR